MADLASYTLAHRVRLDLYRRIITTSTTLRLPVFWNLPDHEQRVAQQLRARHGLSGTPDLDTRLFVARAVAASRVWLDLTLNGDGHGADECGAGNPRDGSSSENGKATAWRLFDRIFDADRFCPLSRRSAVPRILTGSFRVPVTASLAGPRQPQGSLTLRALTRSLVLRCCGQYNPPCTP
jgi:hypothetical protein